MLLNSGNTCLSPGPEEAVEMRPPGEGGRKQGELGPQTQEAEEGMHRGSSPAPRALSL
jgi:hypothetical protein